MNLQPGKTIASALGSLCACLAQPGWAQDGALGENTHARAFQTESEVRDRVVSLVADTAAPRKKSYTASHDGEASELKIALSRESVGRRSDGDYGAERMFRRSVLAEASYGLDILPTLQLSVGARLGDVSSRERAGPLLTRRTHARYASLFLVADTSEEGTYSISWFDQGGWKPGDTADLAARMANREDRARTDVLLRAEFPSSNGNLTPGRKLGIELERSQTPGLRSDIVARITFGGRF